MLKEIMIFVFNPSRFIQMAVDHDKRLPQEEPKSHEEEVRKDTYFIRHCLIVGLLLAFLTLAAGVISAMILGRFISPASRMLIIILQSFAAIIILGATISFCLSFKITTWCGETLLEKTNRWLYCTLYIIGTWILVMSFTWPQ
jgi:cytochrome c biogenesis protein CcdA